LKIPQIQIRQQYAQLDITAELGHYSMEQPRAEQEIRTKPAQLDIEQAVSTLRVDQERAWKAYNGGPALEMNRQIYSQMPGILLEGISRRVQEGHRKAAFHIPGNTIKNIKGSTWDRDTFVEFRGPASFDNVDVRFDRKEANYNYTEGSVDINVQVRHPNVEYVRGPLNIAMKQYAKVEIIPPVIERFLG